jgi:two-component SAPR family response regulator
MTSGSSSANRQAEDAIERIRALNEQILESGREWGQGFLDAYEQSIRTFADFQVRAAEGTDVEWLSQIARAQADFTREVTKYAAEAGRRMLK